jgi:hypothetical protein
LLEMKQGGECTNLPKHLIFYFGGLLMGLGSLGGIFKSGFRWLSGPALATLFSVGIIVLLPSMGRADSSACFSFSASPSTYSAAAGDYFIVNTTFTNCGTDDYVHIGESFGSDESPNIDPFFGIFLFDPSFFLAPGDSITTGFGSYTWLPDAPAGYSQTFNINAVYSFYDADCSLTACNQIGSSDYAFTTFDASVPGGNSEVPEPATLLLFSTGLLPVVPKFRRRKS